MIRPYRVPTGWTDDAARLVWEDYSSRVMLDRGPLIGVEDAVDLEEAADVFHDHDDPEAAARDAIKCLAAHGLAALNEEYACWRGRNCQETTANRLRAWAAVGAPVVSPDAARATAEGLHQIGVAVGVWAGMAAVQQRAVSVVASEPEYPDAESYSSDARADLIAAGFEHPDEVFVMLVQIARGAVSDTKRCILERLSFRAEVRA